MGPELRRPGAESLPNGGNGQPLGAVTGGLGRPQVAFSQELGLSLRVRARDELRGDLAAGLPQLSCHWQRRAQVKGPSPSAGNSLEVYLNNGNWRPSGRPWELRVGAWSRLRAVSFFPEAGLRVRVGGP